ncbi:hypothetical protein VNO77_15257 [Canavalia gladiata]|uniref:Uncharacterized protein n=1 Tax=Canavalia gladiata TaxID=3824 RepID=A0AAN9QRA5_CANGL
MSVIGSYSWLGLKIRHRGPQIRNIVGTTQVPRCSASGPNEVRGVPSYMLSLTFIMAISPAWQAGVRHSDIFCSVRVATRHLMKAIMKTLYSVRAIVEEPTNAALVYNRIRNFKGDEDNNGEDYVELIFGKLRWDLKVHEKTSGALGYRCPGRLELN